MGAHKDVPKEPDDIWHGHYAAIITVIMYSGEIWHGNLTLILTLNPNPNDVTNPNPTDPTNPIRLTTNLAYKLAAYMYHQHQVIMFMDLNISSTTNPSLPPQVIFDATAAKKLFIRTIQ